MNFKRVDNRSGRTIVVGDIHGCFDEFRELLRCVGIQHDDTIVSVGDFLDRGLDSWGVARFFRNTPNAYSVMGNHERRVGRVIKGLSHAAWTQKQTIALLKTDEQDDWAEWLLDLPAVIETDHAIICHARLAPELPVTLQESFFTAAVGGKDTVIPVDSTGVPIWFNEVNLSKPVCIGHLGYGRIELVSGKLYALDTGACEKGHLSAVILPEGRVIQVKSAMNYRKLSLKKWRHKEFVGESDNPLRWPLSKVRKLLENGTINDDEFSRFKDTVKNMVESLPLSLWVQTFNCITEQQLGKLPKTGEARGLYFVNINKIYNNKGVVKIAVKSVKAEQLSFSDVATAFPNITLEEAASVISREIQLQ